MKSSPLIRYPQVGLSLLVVFGSLVILWETPARTEGPTPGSVASAQHHPPARNPIPLIVLDPGHGGSNLGALGPQNTHEKTITLSLAQLVRTYLIMESDVRVVQTRLDDDDVSLVDRMAMATSLGADLFLSLHCNSSPRPGPSGFETFILSVDSYQSPPVAPPSRALSDYQGNGNGHPLAPPDQAAPANGQDGVLSSILVDLQSSAAHLASANLADTIRTHLGAVVPWPDRGVKQAPFDVLMGAAMPSVVIEVGFLNHPKEGQALRDPATQDKIARAIAAAVLEHLDVADQMKGLR